MSTTRIRRRSRCTGPLVMTPEHANITTGFSASLPGSSNVRSIVPPSSTSPDHLQLGGNAVGICCALLTIPLAVDSVNTYMCIYFRESPRLYRWILTPPCCIHSMGGWGVTAADSIDLEDDRWEIFYVFEEKTLREVLSEKWLPEAFVGYFTVFGFRNPVKGASLRICQALILPQFQRQGKVYRVLFFFLPTLYTKLHIKIDAQGSTRCRQWTHVCCRSSHETAIRPSVSVRC